MSLDRPFFPDRLCLCIVLVPERRGPTRSSGTASSREPGRSPRREAKSALRSLGSSTSGRPRARRAGARRQVAPATLLAEQCHRQYQSPVTAAAKLLARMKANPRDWRIENLRTVADACGLAWRQPGGSHVIFRHPGGAICGVPAHRPIQPIDVEKLVRLVEDGVAE